MTTIKLAVFDMAGTTVNENNIVYKTVQSVIKDAGYDLSLDQVLEHGAGKEKYKAITDILTACTDAKNIEKVADKAFEKFKPTLAAIYDDANIEGFDGVEDFFEKLKANGIHVVLNTGYDLPTAQKLLKKLNWEVGKQIDGLITSDDVVNGRPHPDMIQKAMEMFGITDPALVLKAGDSEIDIIEGKNANCGLTIGVLSGAQTKEQLEIAKPDHILENLVDLAQLLKLK